MLVVPDKLMEVIYARKIYREKTSSGSKKHGGVAPKFVSPGIDGMPDRIVLLPMVRIAFVECKATGKKMRPLQIKRKKQLEALGYLVYCLDDVEQIGGILIEIQAT
nr:VRR-NUC domain-containing protein [Vagococcus fluvialis]